MIASCLLYVSLLFSGHVLIRLDSADNVYPRARLRAVYVHIHT